MKAILARLGQFIAPPPPPSSRSSRFSALCIVGPHTERGCVENGCQSAGLHPIVCDSWIEALRVLEASVIPVVLYDVSRTEPAHWREAVDIIENAHGNPSVILLTEWIDVNANPELRDWGGYDILGSPLQAERIESAVRIAWILWKNHTALRQALAAHPAENARTMR